MARKSNKTTHVLNLIAGQEAADDAELDLSLPSSEQTAEMDEVEIAQLIKDTLDDEMHKAVEPITNTEQVSNAIPTEPIPTPVPVAKHTPALAPVVEPTPKAPELDRKS